MTPVCPPFAQRPRTPFLVIDLQVDFDHAIAQRRGDAASAGSVGIAIARRDLDPGGREDVVADTVVLQELKQDILDTDGSLRQLIDAEDAELAVLLDIGQEAGIGELHLAVAHFRQAAQVDGVPCWCPGSR